MIGTVRSPSDEATARSAGAHEVVPNDGQLVARIRARAPEGVDHIIEVAFGANIHADVDLLKLGGSIASYSTDNAAPKIPFWQMVFKNIRAFFLGSDDFPKEAKTQAARDLSAALAAGLRDWRTITAPRYRPCARACRTPTAPGAGCRCAVARGSPISKKRSFLQKKN